MGLGKMVKIAFTHQIKCDKCGRVIVDGTYEKNPRYTSNGERLPSYGGDGVGVFNTLKYGGKKQNLCELCKALEENTKQFDKIVAKENKELEEQKKLEKERMDLEREKLQMEKEKLRLEKENLKQRTNNATVPEVNRTTPGVNKTVPNVKRATNFCSSCGSPLKQNARFCSKCGKSLN
jgi:hypothetical protein